MADKKDVKKSIKQLQRIKTWQLLILLILSLLMNATFLRLNNIGMIERRTAVLNADKKGDQATTRARLFDMQRYTASHMNASSGVIYLEEQYKRDVKNAISVASSNNPDENINVKADQVCKQQYSGYSQAYVQCFANELAKFPANTNAPDKAELPNPNLYRHEFTSPLWSADFAGFSIAISASIGLVIIIRLASLGMLHIILRSRYSSV